MRSGLLPSSGTRHDLTLDCSRSQAIKQSSQLEPGHPSSRLLPHHSDRNGGSDPSRVSQSPPTSHLCYRVPLSTYRQGDPSSVAQARRAVRSLARGIAHSLGRGQPRDMTSHSRPAFDSPPPLAGCRFAWGGKQRQLLASADPSFCGWRRL